jgi:hypothetical protein
VYANEHFFSLEIYWYLHAISIFSRSLTAHQLFKYRRNVILNFSFETFVITSRLVITYQFALWKEGSVPCAVNTFCTRTVLVVTEQEISYCLVEPLILGLIKATDLSAVWLQVPVKCLVLSLVLMTLGFCFVLQNLPEGRSFCCCCCCYGNDIAPGC